MLITLFIILWAATGSIGTIKLWCKVHGEVRLDDFIWFVVGGSLMGPISVFSMFMVLRDRLAR